MFTPIVSTTCVGKYNSKKNQQLEMDCKKNQQLEMNVAQEKNL